MAVREEVQTGAGCGARQTETQDQAKPVTWHRGNAGDCREHAGGQQHPATAPEPQPEALTLSTWARVEITVTWPMLGDDLPLVILSAIILVSHIPDLI